MTKDDEGASPRKVVALRKGDAQCVPLDQRTGPQPLASLWELFFAHSSFGAYRGGAPANLRRTAALCAELGMPEFPVAGDVSIWISRLRELPGRRGKMKGSTVNLHRDNLHAMFKWAANSQKGWVAGNPVDVKWCPFKRAGAMRRALRNVDDLWPLLLAVPERFAEGAELVRWRGFLGVLRFLGVRKSEALGFTTESFYCDDAGVWWAQVSGQRDAESWCLGPTKTPRGIRRLPMRRELVSLLQPVLKLGRTTRVRVGFGGLAEREVPFVFPFREYSLGQMMKALRGLAPDDFPPGDGWHVFRHTVAVELFRRGMRIEEISEWLGHVDIAHTQTYLRTLVGTHIKADLLSYFPEEAVNPNPTGGAPPREVKKGSRRSNAGTPPLHPRSASKSGVTQTRNTTRNANEKDEEN